jgi:hypothetical protein
MRRDLELKLGRGAQVCDEEVAHGSIIAHHDEGNVLRAHGGVQGPNDP